MNPGSQNLAKKGSASSVRLYNPTWGWEIKKREGTRCNGRYLWKMLRRGSC